MWRSFKPDLEAKFAPWKALGRARTRNNTAPSVKPRALARGHLASPAIETVLAPRFLLLLCAATPRRAMLCSPELCCVVMRCAEDWKTTKKFANDHAPFRVSLFSFLLFCRRTGLRWRGRTTTRTRRSAPLRIFLTFES